ncbi:MAG: PQQ-binding-like beta-propeller repeat protein [Bacteroidales bacterium]
MKTGNSRLGLCAALVLYFISAGVASSQLFEWRGPGRTGNYDETGLLKKWPDGGPALLWDVTGMGDGYSSPVVTDDAIYVTGRRDTLDILVALTLDGKKKWEVAYGKAWMTNHTGSRCIPTVYNGKIFLISGSGDMVCVGTDGKIKWSKNHYKLYESKPIMFGISESPVVTGNLVIASPAGKKATLVAFNIDNGNVVWTTEPTGDEPQYVNPKLIDHGGKKIIVTVLSTNILGVDAADGKVLWKYNYVEANAAKGNVMKNHAITPLYRDGEILIANGYKWVALKLKLSPDGRSVEKVWENRAFDPQLGGVVLVGDRIFGANHMSAPTDTWLCVDWKTGQTLWTQKWYARGSVITADNMLILFEEKTGHVALASPGASDLGIISEFQVTKGTGPFWAHPVVRKGIMYIRHGEALMAYRVK